MAGWIEGFAFQHDAEHLAMFLDGGVAPDETVSSEKLEQFRQQVMHQIDVVACSDFNCARLGAFNI
jgi:hypothetical protein